MTSTFLKRGVAGALTPRISVTALLHEAPARRQRWSVALIVGVVMVAGLAGVAILAPQIAPYDMARMAPADRLQGPSWQHVFGTDAFGRDLFSRILMGSRVSLAIAGLSVGMAAVPGILLGMLAGMRPGMLEGLLTRLMDAWIAVPSLLLAVVMASALGRTAAVIAVALALAGLPTYYRQTRAETLLVTHALYVSAARALGCTEWHIAVYHVLPNIMPRLFILLSARIGAMLLAASALGFIGLGVQPPVPEWGALMAEGRNYVYQAWWLTFFPGLAVTVAVFGLNLLGDGLRDLLDPRQQS